MVAISTEVQVALAVVYSYFLALFVNTTNLYSCINHTHARIISNKQQIILCRHSFRIKYAQCICLKVTLERQFLSPLCGMLTLELN